MWESFQIQPEKFPIRALSVYCVYPQHSVVVRTDNQALTLSHAQSTFYNTPLTQPLLLCSGCIPIMNEII